MSKNKSITKVPKHIEYRMNKYEFMRAKGNILIYVSQPAYYYDDWQEDGSILVVKFHPDQTSGNAFEVLHSIDTGGYHNMRIKSDNITGCNRMAKPIYE